MFQYFELDEFCCKYSNQNEIRPEFVSRLDELRRACGFPFHIVSGYRSADHPEEAKKDKPGTHNEGIAADIRISNGAQRRTLVNEALKMGFGGIGVAKTFIHVDDRASTPVMWSY